MTLTTEKQPSADIVDPDLKKAEQCVNELRSKVANSAENISLLFDQLKKLLDSPKVPVRFKIVYELSTIPRAESIDILKRALATDKSPLVRHEAASGLGEIGDESVIGDLVSALDDESGIVRHEAAMALDGIGNETALPKLREHLTDEDPIVTASCEVAISSILSRKTSQ